MRTVERLVEQMVKKWEADRLARRAEEEATVLPSQTRPRTVVAISRETGAGGTDIGRLVASELGYDFFDKEIVEMVASSAHATQALMDSLDERVPGLIDRTLTSLLAPRRPTAETYLLHLSRVMLALAERGRCVIVGRGAGCILPESLALTVRIVAPWPTRVRHVASRTKISLPDAEDYVRRTDRERERFVEASFGKNPADPLQYSLIINTADFRREDAARLIVYALKTVLPRRRSLHQQADQHRPG